MQHRHRFLVVPDSSELGSGPHEGKSVEYEISYQPPTPADQPKPERVTTVVKALFGEPIDLDLDVAPYEPIETRVRFAWATSARLQDFADCYRTW